MMSSAKARPENAEVERRVKRRLQRLHRNRCPPSPVVPSFVTLSELHRGHDIDMSSYAQPTRPTLLQENRTWLRSTALVVYPTARCSPVLTCRAPGQVVDTA